jgi:crossover junction endodeoxyribonuclease RuvC
MQRLCASPAERGIRGESQNQLGMLVVMGIDPGVANTGFGVVRLAGAQMSAVDGGVIEAPGGDPPERRLARIHATLAELVRWHEPAAVALEDVYFGKNVRSAIGVGQARGVAMLAAAERGVPCFDYTPQAVKMAVCGTGAAAKQQVQRMVGALLGLPDPPRSDHAADALAVAICHASHAPPQRRRAALAATPGAAAAHVRPEAEVG